MTDTPSVRFLHTADWQIGLRLQYIPGDTGAVVRDARLRTVRRIGELARERRAAFVVVAGDVFEHHGLKPATVRQTLDALSSFGVPVFLLPGNHDPYTADAIYRTDLWRRECPADVHVLGSTEPVEAAPGVWLLPCPLLERLALEDPTAHLAPSFGPSGVRIGVAHGGVREILERLGGDELELSGSVPADLAARGGLDYAALGDWHSVLRIDDRTWYSGAPEATRFKERDPGDVLEVELDGPGAPPRVTRHPVATMSWRKAAVQVVDDTDLARISALVDGLDDRAETLLELTLTGAIDVELRERLQRDVLDPAADRLRFLRVRDEDLSTFLRDDDIDSIATDGWVREVITTLRDARGDAPRQDADLALRLLYSLHRSLDR